MIDDAVLNYIILFCLLELYEISWQKAQTLMGMLARMYKQYYKSIFLFLIMQPTFYFAIGFAMLTNYAPTALILLFIKTVDIATKIILIEQVFVKRQLSHELSIVLLTPIHQLLPYLGLVFYPLLILFGI